MYLGTMSFADGHGVFCIYRLVDDQYLGILQGRKQPMGMQFKFFRGTRPATNTLFFSNSIFKERKIMKPGQTITLNVQFNNKRLLDSANGYLTYEDGTKVGMTLSGTRTPPSLSGCSDCAGCSGCLGAERSIAEQQRDLTRLLEEMKRQEADANLVLAQQRENEGLVVMPLDQTTYKWVGNRLVKQYPSAIDGLCGCQVVDAFKKAWSVTWGKLFSPSTWNALSKGVGQAPVVRDPWGMPTRNLPISVRYEVEFEDELERIRRQEAPCAKEFIKPGSVCGLMEFGQPSFNMANVYRLDNFVTGKYNEPYYGVAWKDKLGNTHLSIGKKHPHLAVEEYQREVKSGRVATVLDDFDERQFGFDHKMFIYRASL